MACRKTELSQAFQGQFSVPSAKSGLQDIAHTCQATISALFQFRSSHQSLIDAATSTRGYSTTPLQHKLQILNSMNSEAETWALKNKINPSSLC